MCGICGYISKETLDIKQLEVMNNTMIHRGPNDCGTVILEQKDNFFGLAQRRLSIIDLSTLGHQPMFSRDNNIVIVFNGEIYNYLELRQELLSKGYKFRSNTDTEVIIVAYQEWGISCLNKLNGMFALAIYDRRKDELILARDRIGKKPLYYYHKDSVFIFGSELKPIMKHPAFIKEVRTEIISRYLYHQYIKAPDTIFKNTYKLEAGTYLIWKNNSVEVQHYWSLLDQYNRLSKNLITDYTEAKFDLKRLLKDSIEKRMIADVPLGTFLSGGIDSSLVTAIAQDLSASSIKTYSIGFEDPKYDESKSANDIAKHLGTNHTQAEINTSDMLDLVNSIPQYYDEPFADSSQIPTMLVAKLAKQDVTVALSGDGGDELFCGYSIYDNLPMAQKLDALGGVLYHLFEDTVGVNKLNFLNRMSPKLSAIIMNRDIRTKTQLHYYMRQDITEQLVNGGCQKVQFHMEDEFQLNNWQMRRMLLDMLTYLPEDILTKLDRASMKYSLESRCPILDYRIIEYSFKLSHNFKCNKGVKKYILKDIAYDYIPKSLLDRPKKGFGVPIETWLKTSLANNLKLFSEKGKIEKQGIFNYSVINKIIKEFLSGNNSSSYVRILWSFYVFQQWYDHYIENL